MPLIIDGTTTTSECISPSMPIETWIDQYPELKERSLQLKSLSTTQLTSSDKVLYIAQREYATVHKTNTALRYIGSDDATTCHILILQDEKSEVVSIGHFDGESVAEGVLAMVQELIALSPANEIGSSRTIYAHIVGGFEDDRGISDELLRELLNILGSNQEQISLQTACVYHINSNYEKYNGLACPVLYGVSVELSSMNIKPTKFLYKGPDNIMRHARNFSGNSKMLSVYDYKCYNFVIAPFPCVPLPQSHIIVTLRDKDIRKYLSTSPHCEPPEFAQEIRDAVRFLLEHEDDQSLFKNGVARRYSMKESGIWVLQN